MKKIFILFIFLSSCQHVEELQNAIIPKIFTKKNKIEKPVADFKLSIPYRALDASKTITRIGFGSCNDQNKPQPLWKKISNQNLDLFIMMGDNVYASRSEDKPIYNQYIKLNSNKDYTDLREKIPFLATWDDHDYGQNDGGTDNPEKKEVQKLFLNYWSYIKTIIPDNQDGIYHSRIIGNKKERIQIILLDTRYDRTALIPNPDKNESPPRLYLPNTDKDAHILSSTQWSWLQNELKKPAELRFIVSSIQFVATEPGFEKWANFPSEREKMIQLIEKNKIKNVIFLSGDRHLASIAKLKLKNFDLFDITSSALNKPSRATTPEADHSYVLPSYLMINYGVAEINWKQKQVNISIIGEDDQKKITQSIDF